MPLRWSIVRMVDHCHVESLVSRAGLRLVDPAELVLSRRRCGKGFVYLDEKGRKITDRETLQRIRSLAVPPAYKDVRIARDPRAHIQAVGRDDAGRVQHRYHPEWGIVREARKVDRLAALCDALPRIRRRLLRDLKQDGPCRRKALAAAIMLIDRTHIRIGCEDYVHSGRARGAATLLKESVRCESSYLRLSFRGKRGQQVECRVQAPALVKALASIRRLPGRRLFQYRDEEGGVRRVVAHDINAYLEEIAGAPVTAKDFRTLAATSVAARRLSAIAPATSKTGRRRQVAAVMREVAEMLGNTPAVARNSYVHRRVVEAFEADRLRDLSQRCRPVPAMARDETMVAELFARSEGDG